MVYSTHYKFTELKHIFDSPLRSSRHTKEILSLQKCFFDFIKKSKKLTKSMLNVSSVMTIFNNMESCVSNLMEYYCKKNICLPEQIKRGRDIIWKTSNKNTSLTKDLYEDKKIDIMKNNTIYLPSRYLPTRYLPISSDLYEDDYYYEVWKPAQDALRRDFEENDYEEELENFPEIWSSSQVTLQKSS